MLTFASLHLTFVSSSSVEVEVVVRWPCKWAKLSPAAPAAAAAPLAAAGHRAVYRSPAEDGAGVTCSCSAAVLQSGRAPH